jgi:DNA-binding winged helix-turn-helix (wHTH) protein/Tol biopolymer transport system component
MPKIQIGDFLLNQQLSTLKKNEVEVVVEPKLLELLLLFCNNPDRIISREEILDKLWQNSIVTDNAINKMVGNLRKLLQDDPKIPRYIQTVPKRGYRLICSVDIISNIKIVSDTGLSLDKSDLEVQSVKIAKKKIQLFGIVILIFVSLLIFVLVNFNEKKPTFSMSKTQELTRQQGLEFSALHNENGNVLYFLKKEQIHGVNQLWQKNLLSNQASIVDAADLNIVKLIAISTQDDNSSEQLLLLASKNKRCFVYQVDGLSNNKLDEIQPIFDCSSMAINDIVYDKFSKQLIYSAIKANDQTSRIYRFELSAKKHFLMAQPEPMGIGNHNISLSPDGEKLLIMRSNADLHTQLFVLTLQSNEISEHKQFDYFVREAMWHHDSKHILYFPPPPAHQILMSDLSGENQQTIVSISEYLSRAMSLIADGKSILFATNRANYSNRWLTNKDKKKVLDNSTVYEMLPVLLSDNEHYLFVSKRSGKSQLYIGNNFRGGSKLLTQLENYLVFRHIAVSADNNSILLATNNRIWQLPLKALIEGAVTVNTLDDYQIFHTEGFLKAVNWLSSSVTSVTYVHQNHIQLSLIDTISKQESTLDPMWRYAVSDPDNIDSVFLVHANDHSLYHVSLNELQVSPLSNVKTSQGKFIQTELRLSEKFKQLKIHQGELFFIDNSAKEVTLEVFSLTDRNKTKSYKIKSSYGYDVSSMGILLNELVSREGDVHRTVP